MAGIQCRVQRRAASIIAGIKIGAGRAATAAAAAGAFDRAGGPGGSPIFSTFTIFSINSTGFIIVEAVMWGTQVWTRRGRQ
jgi:hypothetical protein